MRHIERQSWSLSHCHHWHGQSTSVSRLCLIAVTGWLFTLLISTCGLFSWQRSSKSCCRTTARFGIVRATPVSLWHHGWHPWYTWPLMPKECRQRCLPPQWSGLQGPLTCGYSHSKRTSGTTLHRRQETRWSYANPLVGRSLLSWDVTIVDTLATLCITQ